MSLLSTLKWISTHRRCAYRCTPTSVKRSYRLTLATPRQRMILLCHSIRGQGTTCSSLNWLTILGESEVRSKSEGFKLWVFSEDERLDNWSILLSYVHHISTRHLRPSSTVRKYIRYHVAYVTRPHELTFSGHVGNQFWINLVLALRLSLHSSSKEETILG